jgi:hypothetical protein
MRRTRNSSSTVANNVGTLRHTKRLVSGVFGAKGSIGQSTALYCRVSTADQTCARQESDLRAFAKKAGHKVVGVGEETAVGAKC